jgi:crotonobetainyl-CoA:carnitine CoA-transferase CaiB-like acyl-CoA transferase
MTAMLPHLTVIDLTQGLSGPFCSMLLGDLGARVLKVEPLAGDWARQLEPRQGSHSAVFLALNRNKESLAIDYQSTAGQEVLRRLVCRADIVICDLHPRQATAMGLDYATLASLYPTLIYGSLTPFGEHGPWAHRAASELVVQAASGYPRYLGTYGEEPVRLGADVASTIGGIFLLQGLLAALFSRLHTGRGQCVAVSQLGALYALKTIQIAAQYDPDVWEGYHCWGPYDPPDTGWRTADRPIVFSFGEFTGGGPDKPSQWPAFCHALGLEHLLQDARFDHDGKNSTGLGADAAKLRPIYEAAFRDRSAAALIDLIRHLGGAAYPYHTHATLFADEQAQLLQLLQHIPGPEGEIPCVKTPWNFSTSCPVRRCGPPALGNATAVVLAELGYDAAQRRQLFTAGHVAGTQATAQPVQPAPSPSLSASGPASVQRQGGPLSGVRVLDISGLGVGPVTGLLLAELGAEVIKVEPPHGDLALTVLPKQRGTSVLYISANLCKRGMVLNLKAPRDLERAYRLAEQADVFIENFRVGVVERLGLGYEVLAERNPRLVYCSLSGFGRVGPLASLPSVDTYIQAFSGFASLNGSPGSGGESLRNIGFIDLTTSALTVPAILAALLVRERTGKGQHIVASMLEAAAALQTSRIAEYLATGQCAAPQGSGMPYAVPDQAFAVRDGYLAVSARTQDEWRRLCGVLGQEELLADPRYHTLADRVAHRHTLIPHLQAIFRTFPAAWWIKRLTQAGVPCGRFHTCDDMCQHPQVRLNGLMAELPTPHWGTIRVAGLPWSFSLTPGVLRPGPIPGEDTAQVLAEVLGEAGKFPQGIVSP